MNTPVYLSLGQSAKEVGKSKATISKALKSGKLSYISKDTSGYKIDPSELFRVFPKTVSSEPIETGNDERLETQQETLVNSILERENQLLREQLEKAETEKERLLDMLQTEQEKTRSLMLSYHQEKKDHPKPNDRWLVWTLSGFTLLVGFLAITAIYQLLQPGM